jgi:hypothetical protein
MSDHKVASQRLGLWCSWIFVALTAIGWLGIAHFHMPARAGLGLDAPDVESRACRRRIRCFHFKALMVYGLT